MYLATKAGTRRGANAAHLLRTVHFRACVDAIRFLQVMRITDRYQCLTVYASKVRFMRSGRAVARHGHHHEMSDREAPCGSPGNDKQRLQAGEGARGEGEGAGVTLEMRCT